MLRILALSLMFWAATNSFGFAEDSLSTGITVLDQNTFIKTDNTIEGTDVIQLFKVRNDEIVLVDAIQIDKKKVNFRSLLETHKLKIERKD